MDRDILDNLQEKLVLGFYLDKINIDGKFEIWEQNKECLVLLCKTGNSDDGSDGIAVYLPLPIRFDEEWYMKYKEINYDNLTPNNIIFNEAKEYKVKDSKIKYKRIPVEVKYPNGKKGAFVIETPFLFSFGVNEKKNQETNKLVGYSIPV